jgi:ABC-type Fe3+-hydroxamate transport system substrate-binding protein
MEQTKSEQLLNQALQKIRQLEEELQDRTRKRFFNIKGSDGKLYKIYYND